MQKSDSISAGLDKNFQSKAATGGMRMG